MRTVFRPGLKDIWKRFRDDQSGIALIYVTAALPVIIGFSLLAIDVGRLSSLQSSLQHGADALALAGAGELDRRPDAITRANRAIANLVTTNESLFGTSVVTIDGSAVSVRYFSAIPGHAGMAGNDASPMPAGTGLSPLNAIDNENARFVEVTVTPVNFNTIFPVTFLGGASNSAQSSATAVAGFEAAVCNFTPMFICNPYEATNNTDYLNSTELLNHFDKVNYPDRIGRLINMKQTGGNGAQYFPGNFGFLTPQGAANAGASELRNQVGMANPPACFTANGVELRTGNIESARFGFNTRFDMYDGPMNSKRNDAAFRPAENVRKGVANDKSNGSGSACNPVEGDTTKHSGLLRDNCFNTNSCTLMSGRMGDGVWNKSTYWSEAHNGAALPSAISGANVSRYDVYNYELADINLRVKNDSNGSPNGGEVGYPACYNGPANTINNTPDRRIFHGAILNCRALDASSTYGPIRGGSSNPLPVIAFVKFFLTEPVGGDKNNANVADGDVWAEMVGIDMPGDASNTARDIVQLYR
ncbi:MAG: TadE/TadG family type IV pilus assembly protein [Aestuariivirga sp.]